MKLTIADTRVDIGGASDLPLATTFEASDLFDPSKTRGDVSSEVDFPQTIGNAILGTVDMSAALSDRVRMPAKIDNGAGVLWSGYAVPRRITKGGHTWELQGNNRAWFDEVRDRKLSDLPLGETGQHRTTLVQDTWDLANGYKYLFPLVDYGNLGDKTAAYDVNLKYVLPAVSVKHIMDKIFEGLGLVPTYRGTLGAHLQRLFFLFNRKIEDIRATQDQLDERIMAVSESVAQVEGLLEFGTVDSDPAGYYLAPGRYLPTVDMRADFEITITIDVTVAPTSAYQLYVRRNGITYEAGLAFVPTLGVQTINRTIENVSLTGGQNYAIMLLAHPTTSVTVASMTVRPINIGWQENISCDLSSAVPEMQQSELLKGIFAAFDCKVDTNIAERSVTITPEVQWKRPISDALDWTGKVDTEAEAPAKVRENIPTFFEFRCAEDSKDRLLNAFKSQYGRGLGDGDRKTTDENAVDTKRVSVPWAATATGSALETIQMPRILDEDEDDPDAVNYGWKPRMVYYNGTTAASWVLDGTAMTEVPDVYFCRKGSAYNDLSLAFGTNRGEYGVDVGLVDRLHYARLTAIEFGRIVECMVHLTDEDIRTLDFSRPVMLRIEGSVSAYYLLKVEEYLWGQGVSTPCRFIEAVGHQPIGDTKSTPVFTGRIPPRRNIPSRR